MDRPPGNWECNRLLRCVEMRSMITEGFDFSSVESGFLREVINLELDLIFGKRRLSLLSGSALLHLVSRKVAVEGDGRII